MLGTQEKTLFGPGFIEDELCGCVFRISAQSFYQINPVQTQVLYETAMEYAALSGQETVAAGEQADVVLMDPPRAGSDEAFLSSVLTLAPKRVVYISCNPETLARDVLFLTKRGYRVQRIQPVDMFPFTNHIEAVVLLTRQKTNAKHGKPPAVAK